ncbi:MAG: hemerythrin domain-containing protein [Burkholderiaceae bacterium]
MTDIVKLWHAEHAKFARLLDHLDDRMTRISKGEDEHIALVAGIVEYLHHYGERAHHRREDVAFAHMANLDQQFSAVVEALHHEHNEIVNAGRLLIKQIESLQGNATITREALEANTRRYIDLQRSHLKREDVEIIPGIDKRFGDSDWREVGAEISRSVDTHLSKELVERFRVLGRELTEELAPG